MSLALDWGINWRMTTTVMPIRPQWNVNPEDPVNILRLLSEMEGSCQILGALVGDDHPDYIYIREAANRWYKEYFKRNKEYEAAKRQREGT
jgi:hypothetical protein